MTNRRHIDKSRDSRNGKFPKCGSNITKIEGLLFCWKCMQEKKRGRNRSFPNCSKLYRHLTISHSGSDKNEFPARDDCIEQLQIISNAIVLGVLK